MRLYRQLTLISLLLHPALAAFSIGEPFVDFDWEYLDPLEYLPLGVNITESTIGTYAPCGFGIYPRYNDTYAAREHPDAPLPVLSIYGGGYINLFMNGDAEFKFTLSRGPDDPWHEFYPSIVTKGEAGTICINTTYSQELIKKIWPEPPKEDQAGWIQVQAKMDDYDGQWTYRCAAVNFSIGPPPWEGKDWSPSCYNDSRMVFKYKDDYADWNEAWCAMDYDDENGHQISACSNQSTRSGADLVGTVSSTASASFTSGITDVGLEPTTITHKVDDGASTTRTAASLGPTVTEEAGIAAPAATNAASRVQEDGSVRSLAIVVGCEMVMLGFSGLL